LIGRSYKNIGLPYPCPKNKAPAYPLISAVSGLVYFDLGPLAFDQRHHRLFMFYRYNVVSYLQVEKSCVETYQ